MSEIIHWTNLPKGITPDFVSHDGDYDYPLYLSEKEEWVNYKHMKNIKGKITVCEPFLIMELNRFVPFLRDKYVKFHPLNMPYIRIGKVEIVGFVISTRTDAKFCIHQIDDGSGSITVYHERKHFELSRQQRKRIDEKYRQHAMNIDIKLFKHQVHPKRFPNPRPQFGYPDGTSLQDMAIFEHNWFLETKNGLLGKEVQRRDYIHAVGYCSLDFMFNKKSQEEITFQNLCTSKLTFAATKVDCIPEHEYNSKLCSWFHTVVRRRYDDHANKPKSHPQNKDVEVPAIP